MMKTICRQDGSHWVSEGRKTFITRGQGAEVGIVMVKAEGGQGDGGACMFLVELRTRPSV